MQNWQKKNNEVKNLQQEIEKIKQQMASINNSVGTLKFLVFLLIVVIAVMTYLLFKA